MTSPPALGASVESGGMRFTLFSQSAEAVHLCLFDTPESQRESDRIELTHLGAGLWTTLIPGVEPGKLYGYRVDGPFNPSAGHRFNPNKVLLDPYTRVLGRYPIWDQRLYGHSSDPNSPDTRDNADVAPLGRVIDSTFDWQGDTPPGIPWEHTLLYETHVKSISQLHPEMPEPLRGSYSGLASEPVLDHLKRLGVTAVELLPIQQRFDEWLCHKNGLTNYWGYNTLAFFAPDIRFSSGNCPVIEFKQMVKALHQAGLEVILDVVYNHTAEGPMDGPTLSFRGIDNATYYRTELNDPSRYQDVTGCGNTLNMNSPAVLGLVLDSLRYWVSEMHVDGFRFDLASALARGPDGFDPAHPFFEEIKKDPVLSQVKLIAEPWDLGQGGYQLSAFPSEWSEWNDQYRDTVRRFWRGDARQTGLLARRLAGSGDVYSPKKRPPSTSINQITCHDGFTLEDWVSYERRHNETNREGNHDGSDHNISQNFGEEGTSLSEEILALRSRQKRNAMATLLFSLGTPMLSGGDELGQTHWGNNNPWCQDNTINWFSWDLSQDQQEFLDFVRSLIEIRKRHPVFSRSTHFDGTADSTEKDVTWLLPDGREKTASDWDKPDRQTFGALLREPSVDGNEQVLLLLFHADQQSAMEFNLPNPPQGFKWKTVVDTYAPHDPQPVTGNFSMMPMSMAVLEAIYQ